MTPSQIEISSYRENPNRAFHLTRKFDGDLLNQMVKTVTKYRSESSDPITIYICSLGGEELALVQILGILKSPDHWGGQVKIITVVTGHAVSAAAELLSLGDYAIAHRESIILFHGARISSEAMTRGKAVEQTASLIKADQGLSERLVATTFPRLLAHFLNLRKNFPRLRRKERRKLSDIQCFAEALGEKLPKGNPNNLIFDSVDERRIKESKETLNQIATEYGCQLLTPREFAMHKAIRTTNSVIARRGLLTIVKPRIRPLLQFTIALCRLLHDDENPLSAEEAFWLGLIDEVRGTDLKTTRQCPDFGDPDPALMGIRKLVIPKSNKIAAA